jgi:hypothetical protein
MPTHDIVDNRQERLVDHINRILSSTEAARFAVGYFFLSGLTSIAERFCRWVVKSGKGNPRAYGGAVMVLSL